MATATIPNLWPPIKVDVITPYAILQAQASRLSELTQGLLRAEITNSKTSNKAMFYHFDVIAPVLNNYRHTLLVVEQSPTRAYPVKVEGISEKSDKIWRRDVHPAAGLGSMVKGVGERDEKEDLIYTNEEFINRVGEILQSAQAQRIITSLITRSNEQASEKSEPQAA